MRVGIYIDGYNLYYGARSLCGRGKTGWRWLNLRALSERIVAMRQDWPGAQIERIVYCTARVGAGTNPSGQRDQDVYLKALVSHGSVDHIEYGRYVARAKPALLASEDARGRPSPVTSQWPVMIRDANDRDVPNARFMVKVYNVEEKGSDVNVATHLLIDVLKGDVEAVIVVSNDSDLGLPVKYVRGIVPVGLVNPHPRQLAGALRGDVSDGVGRHWWYRLGTKDLHACQLPSPVGRYHRPSDW